MSSSSPVPRACRNCSAAKAKCTWISRVKCERCNRLKKDCNTQILSRQAKISRAAQVAQIDKKLDRLISILGASHQLPLNVAELASDPGIIPDASYNASPPAAGPSGSTVKCISTRPDDQYACPSEAAVLVSSSIVDQVLRNGQANKLVEFYRSALAFHTPSILIPGEKTAQDLYNDSPFLLRTMLFSASYDNPSQQRYFEKDIMKYISDHLILKGERSIDLLQGLLVYITWYHHHKSGPFQTTLLLQLALATLNDLGLSRASPARETQESLLNEIKHPEQCAPKLDPLSYTSCRMILGCFYLSSSITASSSKLDPMRYTSYIGDCVQRLAPSIEGHTDSVLAHMVKLQKIVLDAQSSSSGSTPSQKGQARMYVKIFQKALREYESALPMTLRQDKSLLLHYHTAEIHIYQVGLHMTFSAEEAISFERIDILSACLSATKNFCHVWLSLPPSMYHTLTLIHFGQLTRALLVMVRLCVFEAEDWDASEARQAVNMPAVIDEMIYRMESAVVALDENEMLPCPFTRSVKSLKLGKAWYEAEIRKLSAVADLNMHVYGASLDASLLWDHFQGGVAHLGEG